MIIYIYLFYVIIYFFRPIFIIIKNIQRKTSEILKGLVNVMQAMALKQSKC